MKVASISHLFPNSVYPTNGVFVKERLKHVAAIIDLSVVAPVPAFPFIGLTAKYAGIGRIPPEEIIEGLLVYHPRYFMIPKYFKYFDARFYAASLSSFMEKLLRADDYDLLDFHWVYPDGIGGLDWARTLHKKTVATVRGNEAIFYFNHGPLRKIVQKRLAEFDHVIAVSNDLRDKIVREYGVPFARSSVIQNGVDTAKFHPGDRRQAVAACGLDGSRRHVVTVCRLSREKGLEYLIRAFAGLRRNDTELTIVGDGPLGPSLKALCRELRVAETVHFHPPMEHTAIRSWYNAADLFCLSSLWEGCPNVIIEALACGTPVVATRVGGIPDLVPADGYGLLVPPGDVPSLTAALDRGLERAWDRRGIAAFGAANSWENVADRVIKVYERVVA